MSETASTETSLDKPTTTTTAAVVPGGERSLGKTTIAAAVVQKIAGIAAKEIDGIDSLGGSVSRAFGAIRERIPGGGASAGQGVSVEVGEKQAAVDLDLVVEYGISITEIAQAVRRNVISAVEHMTGLEVIEVNISVHDIVLPTEERPAPVVAASRVE
jgi:uncharacterized alkaline shock family protein YloU